MTSSAAESTRRPEPPGVLEGTLVLDLGRGAAARYLGRLFADLGARVVAASPASPPAGRSDHDLWASYSKELLPRAVDAATIERLTRAADLVVDDADGGVRGHAWFDSLDVLNPRAVHVTLSPFGLEGPYAGFRGDANLAEALCGVTWQRGDAAKPPLALQSRILEHAQAMNALAAAMVALHVARRGGPGQRVEVTALETSVMMNESLAAMAAWNGASPTRLWDPTNYLPGAMRCADRWIYAFASQGAHWEALGPKLLGDPAFLEDPRFRDHESRIRNADAMRASLADWFASRPARPVFEAAQAARLPFGLLATPGELADEPQLRARSTFVTVGARKVPASAVPAGRGFTVRPREARDYDPSIALAPSTATAAGSTAGAAAAGPCDPRRPLAHLKVVDLSHYWAGPNASRVFADFGADVIRVESFTRVDGMRTVLQADNLADDRPWERGWSAFVNRNKRSLAVDLDRAEGRELLLELVATADLVIENFTPRVLPKWNLGYERLRQANPRVVLLSLSGFGQTGPWANFVAMGPTLESLSGASSLAMHPGDPRPRFVDSTLSDPVCGLLGAGYALAALGRARATGTGEHLDLAQFDTLILLAGDEALSPGRREPPAALRYESMAAAGTDEWVLVDTATVTRERVAALGVDAEDPLAGLRDFLRPLDKRAAMHRLQSAGIAAAAVLRAAETYFDPQLRARDWYRRAEHPVFRVYPLGGPNAKLSRTPGSMRTRSPLLGEHNREVLRQHGFDEARIAELESSGVIGREPRPPLKAAPASLRTLVDVGAITEPEPGLRDRICAGLRPLDTE